MLSYYWVEDYPVKSKYTNLKLSKKVAITFYAVLGFFRQEIIYNLRE